MTIDRRRFVLNSLGSVAAARSLLSLLVNSEDTYAAQTQGGAAKAYGSGHFGEWIEDEFGRQRWFWWDPHTGAWSGASRQEPPLIAGERWTYIGGAVVPQRSAGFQTQVTDQLRRPPRQ